MYSATTSTDNEAIKLAHGFFVTQPCDNAAIPGLSCKQVHDYMVESGLEVEASTTITAKKFPEDKNGGLNTGNEHAHDKRRQPTPCHHPGLSCSRARTKCSCFSQRIYCYKACGCQASCRRRYRGCRCTGVKACSRIKAGDPDGLVRKCPHTSLTFDKGCDGCKLKRLEENKSGCQCQLLNRECDPDICKCGVARILSDSKGSKESEACQNCDMQKGGMKDMVIGASAIAGYGLFLNEPVKFGKYLGEYVGEIINHEEGEIREERRRKKLDPGYLFTINTEFVIDSTHFGNVTRFINHTCERQNCHGLVKLVNGEHRIGFWSIRDSSAGTELLFDYGREFEEELSHSSARKDMVAKHVSAKSRQADRSKDSEEGSTSEPEPQDDESDNGLESDMEPVQPAPKDDTEDDDDE